MKVTISDIARIANVSKATVSRVINHKSQGVSEETARRIMEIIEREGYLPNSLARSIVVSRTRTLGLVVPDIGNPFFSQMVRGIIISARALGYTVLLCNSDNNCELEESGVMSLIEKRVDGVALISSARKSSAALQSLRQHEIPVVQIDRVVGGHDSGASVVIDNCGGMREATAYLLGKGHRRIAFLGGTEGVYTTVERYRGFRQALDEAGVSVKDAYVAYGHYDIESGEALVREMLARTSDVTAIVAGCDLIGIGVIKALRRAGIDVPGAMEIIGFDGIQMTEVVEPALSTVVQPIRELAEEATGLLVGMIDGRYGSARRLIIEPSLCLRGTTRASSDGE